MCPTQNQRERLETFNVCIWMIFIFYAVLFLLLALLFLIIFIFRDWRKIKRKRLHRRQRRRAKQAQDKQSLMLTGLREDRQDMDHILCCLVFTIVSQIILC